MRRCIRIGTGGGLKSLWPKGRVGSNPTTATTYADWGARALCPQGPGFAILDGCRRVSRHLAE